MQKMTSQEHLFDSIFIFVLPIEPFPGILICMGHPKPNLSADFFVENAECCISTIKRVLNRLCHLVLRPSTKDSRIDTHNYNDLYCTVSDNII